MRQQTWKQVCTRARDGAQSAATGNHWAEVSKGMVLCKSLHSSGFDTLMLSFNIHNNPQHSCSKDWDILQWHNSMGGIIVQCWWKWSNKFAIMLSCKLTFNITFGKHRHYVQKPCVSFCRHDWQVLWAMCFQNKYDSIPLGWKLTQITQNVLCWKGLTRIINSSSQVNGPYGNWTYDLGVISTML